MQAEEAGVKILCNANVYKLEHDAQGRITAALYYDVDKTSHRVTAKTFILAANGIESPRLLLVSASDKYPNGLANSSDMVGRNLMDHPSTSITFDADEDLWLGRGPQSPNSINTMRDGDFRRTYLIIDRMGVRVLRDPYTKKPYVLFYTTKRVGGGVQNPEAMRALKIAA